MTVKRKLVPKIESEMGGADGAATISRYDEADADNANDKEVLSAETNVNPKSQANA